jgi:hypothetical protein
MGAFVNLETGEITGAKKYSLVWFHEVAHLQFHKLKNGERISYNEQLSFQFAFVWILISFFWQHGRWMALLMGVTWFYFFVYEEVWCWIRGFKMHRKYLEEVEKLKQKEMKGGE